MGRLVDGCAVAAALALAACSDPRLEVEIHFIDPTMKDALASLTLSVVELPAHPDGSPVECDEVRYGRISPDQLDGGRRTSASAGEGVSLVGVPRLGEKLVLLEGRNRRGIRIAGGCSPLHDIVSDTRLPIDAEVAPLLRQIGLDGEPHDPSAPLTDVQLAVLRPWQSAGNPVGVQAFLQVDVLDRKPDRPVPATTVTAACVAGPCAPGGSVAVATIEVSAVEASPNPSLSQGPVELEVRAPWAQAPLVIGGFEMLTTLNTSPLAPASVNARAGNLAEPSWAVIQGDPIRAAALYATAEPRDNWIVLHDVKVTGTLGLTRSEIHVDEPVYSLAAWDGHFVVRTARGWFRVEGGALVPEVLIAGEPATDLVAIEPCETGESQALLARGLTGGYVAYDAPGQVHQAPDDDLVRFVDEINSFEGGRIVSAICLTYASGTHRTVVVRTLATADGGVAATHLVRLERGTPAAALAMTAPVIGGVIGYPDHLEGNAPRGPWRLAGAALAVTGPQLASYTVTAVGQLGGEDGRLTGELATLPVDTAVVDLDQDRVIDLVVTAHDLLGQTRLQVTYPEVDDRPALTGLSPPIRGVGAQVLLERVPSGRWVAGVATSELVTLFDLGAQ